jgi:hypothetical protein
LLLPIFWIGLPIFSPWDWPSTAILLPMSLALAGITVACHHNQLV